MADIGDCKVFMEDRKWIAEHQIFIAIQNSLLNSRELIKAQKTGRPVTLPQLNARAGANCLKINVTGSTVFKRSLTHK
jgi:hypothetical protein